MNPRGWLALHRRAFVDDGLRRGEPLCALAAWLYLEALANWRDSDTHDPPLEAGQAFVTFPGLAERWEWTRPGDSAADRRRASERVRSLFRAWKREGRIDWTSAGGGLVVTLEGYSDRQWPTRADAAPRPQRYRNNGDANASAAEDLRAGAGAASRAAPDTAPHATRPHIQNTDPEHSPNTRLPSSSSSPVSVCSVQEGGGHDGDGESRAVLPPVLPADREIVEDADGAGPTVRLRFRGRPDEAHLEALRGAGIRFVKGAGGGAGEWRAASTWERVALLSSIVPWLVEAPHPDREGLEGWSTAPALPPVSVADPADHAAASVLRAVLEEWQGAPRALLAVRAVRIDATPEGPALRLVTTDPAAAARIDGAGWLEVLADAAPAEHGIEFVDLDLDLSAGARRHAAPANVVPFPTHRTGNP